MGYIDCYPICFMIVITSSGKFNLVIKILMWYFKKEVNSLVVFFVV